MKLVYLLNMLSSLKTLLSLLLELLGETCIIRILILITRGQMVL